MKNMFKKILVCLLTVVILLPALSTAAGPAFAALTSGYIGNMDTSLTKNVIAPADEATLNVENGGGIRFATNINLEKYAALKQFCKQRRIKGVAVGTLIAPLDYVLEAGEFSTMALGFLDFDPHSEVVFSSLANTEMSSGDSDDFVKIIIKTPNKPIVDIEINNTDAYSDYNVKLQGTRGTFKTTTTKYKMKYLIPGENPERPYIETFLQDGEGNPLYCSEKLISHEEEGSFAGTAFDVGTEELYKDMYFALTEGKPLRYDINEYKQVIGVIDRVHADNPLTVKF